MTEERRKYVLQHPVYTLEGKELVPAGAELTEEILKGLSAQGKTNGNRMVRLLEYGTIRRDLLDSFSHPPYDVIFSPPERTAAILEIMTNVRLMIPVLECLEYFKQEDFYTYRHMLLVFALSILLGLELRKDDPDFMNGALVSPAHDFGKICVPPEVLKKNHPLKRTEWQILEHHTLAGFVLLKYYNDRPLSALVARDHHERRNGSGYPLGISLNDPLVEIVVVCDIFDALMSPRPYRPNNYDNRTALEEICEQAERGELSLDVVKALVACNRKSKPHYTRCALPKETRGTPPTGNNYGIVVED